MQTSTTADSEVTTGHYTFITSTVCLRRVKTKTKRIQLCFLSRSMPSIVKMVLYHRQTKIQIPLCLVLPKYALLLVKSGGYIKRIPLKQLPV